MKKLSILLFILLPLLTSAQSFKEKEVKRDVTGGTLYGTMLNAKNANGTVVVFISGSGPTDRDGNSAMEGKNNSLKMLAQELGNKGYSSLRVDKRGIAKSAPGFSEKDIRLETYVDDIVDWTAWVKANNKDVKKIVIAGHSEGSLIGMLAVQKLNADDFISLAGSGVSGDSILKVQLETKVPSKVYEQSVIALDSLKAGHTINTYPQILAGLFHPSVQPYIISWIKYNPSAEITKLTCPILILQGLNDLQITKADAEALAKAAPKAQLVLADKVTHTLKEAGPTYAENLDTYKNEKIPLSPQVSTAVLNFLSTIK
ncbi:MAG: alpha/beta hydrolase [Sphingobacteriales bacterium JAD_PAG50586_3]|nr:MAG: alpha/beta hydrolase [Sphingobacteriales bacterium JAD_PAG50586_3]